MALAAQDCELSALLENHIVSTCRWQYISFNGTTRHDFSVITLTKAASKTIEELLKHQRYVCIVCTKDNW